MAALRAYCDVCDRKVEPKKTRNVNHILHFIMSCLTVGFWLWIWLIAAISLRQWTCPICKANLEASVSKAKSDSKEALRAAEAAAKEDNAPFLQRLLSVLIGAIGCFWCYVIDTRLLVEGLSWFWYAPYVFIILTGLGGGSVLDMGEENDSLNGKIGVFVAFVMVMTFLAWAADWVFNLVFG